MFGKIEKYVFRKYYNNSTIITNFLCMIAIDKFVAFIALCGRFPVAFTWTDVAPSFFC